MTTTIDALVKALTPFAEVDLRTQGVHQRFAEHVLAARAALACARADQGEPLAWLVCSKNKDGSLSPEYAAAWREAAHDHINEAISEHDIEGAADWVVRPVYTTPPATPAKLEPLTDAECDAVYAALHRWAQKIDPYRFGLPYPDDHEFAEGKGVIRRAIETANSAKPEGTA